MCREAAASFNRQDVLTADESVVRDLRARAADSDDGVYRLCLHRSTEDPVQEMIIAMRGDHIRPPHRHPGIGETYIVLDGALTIFLFDAEGSVTRSMDLRPKVSGAPFCAHIAAGLWHMIVPDPAGVVLFEAHAGPFRETRGNEWAAWAPGAQDREGLAELARRLRKD